MISQTVFDTSEILRSMGLNRVILCPGSRNAPLTVSFARNPAISCFSAIDERSAGFMALGMALQTREPAAACCTSGTALLNFGPAAAEAYYQEIPLVLISADRPPEWIGQRDGQTVQQNRALEPHVKASYQLPVDLHHPDARWEYRRLLCEAMLEAQSYPKGPVHINIPFREPFYPAEGQSLDFSSDLPFRSHFDNRPSSDEASNELLRHWRSARKRLVVLGQGEPTPEQKQLLSRGSRDASVTVLSDIISNGYDIENAITVQDLLLQNDDLWEELRPEIVVTLGQSLISKQLKRFLRPGVAHWHLSQGERSSDPFQSLVGEVPISTETLALLMDSSDPDTDFYDRWQGHQQAVAHKLRNELKTQPFSDYVVFQQVMQSLPPHTVVHLANSMAVRYANFFQQEVAPGISFQSNRGTSGIDGSNSTAVGFAIQSKELNILLTGDVSLLYDRNAFLHDHLPSNLKIIVVNNFGGRIFDLIPGPRRLEAVERDVYLGTSHQRSMQAFATSEGFSYSLASDQKSLVEKMTFFLETKGPALLEVQTSSEQSRQVYERIKSGFMRADQ